MIEAEAFGETGAHDVRQLRRRIKDELPEPRMPLRDEPPSLDRRHALARRAERAGDLDGSCPRHRREIVLDERFEHDVVAPGLVHQWGAGPARGEHVADHRQLVEIDADFGGEVLRLGAGFGDAHRDYLADMAYFPRC